MSQSHGGRQTKVARVIDGYDLTGMGHPLEAAWTSEPGERTSLRDLADEFNEAVLGAALRDAGGALLGFEASGTYETQSSGTYAAANNALNRVNGYSQRWMTEHRTRQ